MTPACMKKPLDFDVASNPHNAILVRSYESRCAQSLRIEIRPGEAVSALLIQPPQARACYVFAHGAGAGMAHASMETIAAGLGERGIATLRYQFPYMEKGSKRPDAPAVAHAAVRAAVAEAGAMLSLAAADCGRQIVRRADDVAGAGARAACPAFAGWRFSAFRCIRPESLPAIAPNISPMSKSPCCSCRARAMRWRN